MPAAIDDSDDDDAAAGGGGGGGGFHLEICVISSRIAITIPIAWPLPKCE